MAVRANSVETIFNYNREDNLSDWSMVWSTTQVPGMDTATGGGSRRRKSGRRRLRMASLSLCSMLTMHCHVISASVTSGYFIFMLMMIPSVALLANPLRHFEVYLGEWSISGPGRAFRFLPMFDGVGIAICIHAITRAIASSVMAALTMLYVWHSISDDALPFTYCRHLNLTPYEPERKFVDKLLLEAGIPLEEIMALEDDLQTSTVGLNDVGWKKAHYYEEYKQYDETRRTRRTTTVCKESYSNKYPPIYRTPPYNFFYVELIHYREDHSFASLNLRLVVAVMIIWLVIWIILLWEKISYGRIIWNNMYPWFSGVPWIWSIFVLFTAVKLFFTRQKDTFNTFQIGGKREILSGIMDALIVSTYIHAAGLGTEIIHGKGLNYYASGHLDPHLNSENLWHSGFLLLLTALSSAGADICALADSMHIRGVNDIKESSSWVFPMFSKCALQSGKFSHITSAVIFAGLTFSYMVISFASLKSALHTVFEYRVKLVFIEQLIVGLTVLSCAAFSVLFATNGGLALLEGVDAIMSGVGTPLVCGLETFGLIYVYRSHDFISDINIATEENACSSRLGIQWQIIPFICFIVAIGKTVLLASSEIPSSFLWLSSVPMISLILAIPLHAIHNAISYVNRPRRT